MLGRGQNIECPFCENIFYEEEADIFEDAEGDLFMECPYCESELDMDLDEVMKTVVRHGKKKKVRVKTRRLRRTSKQKQALIKARRKAHSSKARTSRKKSMRLARMMADSFDYDPDGYLDIVEAYDEDYDLEEGGRRRRVRAGDIEFAPTAAAHRLAAREFRMSGARKRALQKARRRAHTGRAKAKRKKSRRKGQMRRIY